MDTSLTPVMQLPHPTLYLPRLVVGDAQPPAIGSQGIALAAHPAEPPDSPRTLDLDEGLGQLGVRRSNRPNLVAPL